MTLAGIKEEIASEHYFTAAEGAAFGLLASTGFMPGERETPEPLHRLTFCVLVLKNGFTVTGESACVSPENFDAELGRQIAREKAVEKVWPLLGFMLRDMIYEQNHRNERESQ